MSDLTSRLRDEMGGTRPILGPFPVGVLSLTDHGRLLPTSIVTGSPEEGTETGRSQPELGPSSRPTGRPTPSSRRTGHGCQWDDFSPEPERPEWVRGQPGTIPHLCPVGVTDTRD